MDNRDTYRSKNGFNFESDDSKFPYDGYQFYGTKKAAIFNYSNEVFRRKKASGAEGLYLIDGGNIPSDMAGSASYASPPDSEHPYPTVSCDLNKGTAGRLESVTAINLSPNRLPETATPCVAPKYPLPDINPEEGKDQKPNFMYMPMYQYSCSKHPRAAGLAHEDNYDCLKKPMTAGNAGGFCCAAAAECMLGVQFFKKTVDLNGKPGFQQLNREPFFQFVSCLGPFGGSSVGLPPDITKESFYREECNYQASCKSGYSYGFAGTGDIGKVDGPTGAGCANEKDGDTAWLPYAFGVTRLYNISGNTECNSCKAPGGIVYINGYTDCFYCEQKCWKLNDQGFAIAPCVQSDGTATPRRIKKKCNEATTSGGSGGTTGSQFCACNFTDTIDFGGTTGTVYATSFQYPTYMFSNWAPIGLSGAGGTLASTSCNGEFVYSCDEIS
jgi:hypothetical protein